MKNQLEFDSPLRAAIRQRRLGLLYLLWAVDVAFVVLYGLYGFRIVHDPGFSLIVDWSYSEMFQYGKEFMIVLMLAYVAWRWRSALVLSWCLAFTYILLDDAAQIHERAGAWVASVLGFVPALGLRDIDFGELAVSAAAGIVLVGLILVAYLYANRPARQVSNVLLAGLAGLVFFGICVDMIPHTISEHRLVLKGIAAFEDGGEMIVMSAIIWFAFWLVMEIENRRTPKVALAGGSADPGSQK